LIKALGDNDSWVRSEAAEALSKIKDSRLNFMEKYLELVMTDISTYSYYNILTTEEIEYILLCFRNSKTVKALYVDYIDEQKFAYSEPCGVELILPARFIIRSDDGSYPKNIISTYIKALENPYWRVCKLAAETLGKIGPEAKAAIPALKKISEDYKDSSLCEVGKAAKEAISKIESAS
jgi:HEAT repeat protein